MARAPPLLLILAAALFAFAAAQTDTGSDTPLPPNPDSVPPIIGEDGSAVNAASVDTAAIGALSVDPVASADNSSTPAVVTPGKPEYSRGEHDM